MFSVSSGKRLFPENRVLSVMKTQRELLEDFRDDLEDLQEEVEEEIQRLDDGGQLEQDFTLIRSLLGKLDDRRERMEFIRSLDPGTRTFIPPTNDDELQHWEKGSDSREERMGEIRRSLFRVWDEATSSYIHGRFYASVVTMAAALEGVLKHELERNDIEYSDWSANLDTCVSRARSGGILPHSGEVSEAADRVVKIRNGAAHFNPERNLDQGEFSRRVDMDRRRPSDEVDHPGAEVIEMWGDAAQTMIEDAYQIINYIYEGEI